MPKEPRTTVTIKSTKDGTCNYEVTITAEGEEEWIEELREAVTWTKKVITETGGKLPGGK
jgi:translation initiation factor 2 alpha subunit (eIF-2alpha)